MFRTLSLEDLAVYQTIGRGSRGPSVLQVASAPVRVQVGTEPLVGRECIIIYNTGTTSVFWGLTNAVTVNDGLPITPGSALILKVNPAVAIDIWLVATASTTVRVMEVKS